MNPFDPIRSRDLSDRGRPPLQASEARAGRPPVCDEVEGDITAYFDGEANDVSALRARRHLDACSTCARMWRDWGDSRLLLRSDRVPDVPASWPESLIQRARLQALLPTLFPPSAHAPSAHRDEVPDGANSDMSPIEVPSDLHQAILKRTTRAVSWRVDDPSGQSNTPRARSSRRISWPVASACVPALAAWILIITAPLAPRTPLPSAPAPLALSNMLSAFSAPQVARRAESPAATAPTSKPQVEAASPANSPSTPSRPAIQAPATPALRVLNQHRRSVRPLAAQPGFSPAMQTAEEERAASLSRGSSRLSSRRTRASKAAVDEAQNPVASQSTPAPQSQAQPVQQELEPTPSVKPVAATSSPSRRARRVAEALRTALKPQVKLIRAAEVEVAAIGGAHGAEHEPLEAALELSDLNDARPDEISEAVDAYAATWVEEDAEIE